MKTIPDSIIKEFNLTEIGYVNSIAHNMNLKAWRIGSTSIIITAFNITLNGKFSNDADPWYLYGNKSSAMINHKLILMAAQGDEISLKLLREDIERMTIKE